MRVKTSKLLLWFAGIGVFAAAVTTILAQVSSDTTVYAPAYTEDGFGSVKRGMTEAQVLNILGQPLSMNEEVLPEFWLYGSASPSTSSDDPSRCSDCTRIVYDTSGLVSMTYRNRYDIKRGQSKEDVLRTAGTPDEIVPRRTKTFSYTLTDKNYGYYNVRQISFDEAGLVARKVAYKLHD